MLPLVKKIVLAIVIIGGLIGIAYASYTSIEHIRISSYQKGYNKGYSKGSGKVRDMVANILPKGEYTCIRVPLSKKIKKEKK